MRHRFLFAAVFLALLMGGGGMLAQEVIDRVAARVENDIILVSDIRELARYQMLLEGKSESDEQILDRLIDQWIVRNEATVSRYAQPSAEEVQRSLARIKRTFASLRSLKNGGNRAG